MQNIFGSTFLTKSFRQKKNVTKNTETLTVFLN